MYTINQQLNKNSREIKTKNFFSTAQIDLHFGEKNYPIYYQKVFTKRYKKLEEISFNSSPR